MVWCWIGFHRLTARYNNELRSTERKRRLMIEAETVCIAIHSVIVSVMTAQ